MDTPALAQDILRRWSDAIALRDLDALAGMFAPDAVFVATAPVPLVGRAAIRAYYAAAPAGLRVKANLALATGQGGGMTIVADVVFDIPGRGNLPGRLSLCCGQGPSISLYHLALTSGPA